MSTPEPLVILAGPTAVGKTGLAVAVCQKFGSEVVSADSVQVYRGLDIGSAKPTPREMALAPHHLVDVADPEDDFDAARFVELADQAIARIQERGKRVLVAGGTGLYLRALLHGLVPAPEVDPKLRERLHVQWQEQGPGLMHQRLAELDPQAAEKLHPNDRQRVLRALEVCIQTGRPFSQLQREHSFQKERHPYLLIGLERPRSELNQRIDQRCRQMWEQRLLDEVQGLLAQGVSPRARSLASLGYKQALMVLNGEVSQEEAMELMAKETRAYAKRQMTWFRGMKGINWHSAKDAPKIMALIQGVWRSGKLLGDDS